ncbi:hypothetical protein JAAARDRAFT_28830 [Jaapia argillacea MUCL 33604]|uniref:30S ribosomal protein S15 n=1 Tax=Jaapia argillacea MUCL 33604 TaxID=933084 RepID=A0A067Q792_9AGAM|nr:hypothetical protein JAAARDRAFT_28830 [Jaapia argillacea MUCL 33604]
MQRKRQAKATRQSNLENRADRQRSAVVNRPHVVLGTRPGEEHKWTECDLAKLLLTEQQIRDAPIPDPVTRAAGKLWVPSHLNFGVGEVEQKMLLDDLPLLSVQSSMTAVTKRMDPAGLATGVLATLTAAEEKQQKQELLKSNNFAKLIDLKNANAKGIAFENRKRVVAAFSTPENPCDPGRSEVQAAQITMKIRALWEHLTKFKRDVGNRRGLRKYVHQRAKILKYLKRVDRDRYDALLPRIGLEPESVEGELVV